MTQLFKQKLTLLFIVATLIIAFAGFIMSNQSLAWFSKNKEVAAQGFSVSAKVSPNLVISKDKDGIMHENILFSVDFTDTAREKMIAVTHDSSAPDTYLKYLTSHHAVDLNSGNAKPGMELEFATVPSVDNEKYFVDHTVYIASTFESLEVDSLKASIKVPETVDDEHFYFNAASIDFYVNEVSAAGYRGTTSVAKCINDDPYMNVDLLPGGGTVPLNTEGYITVIMRCYFDGALQDSDTGIAYVNSNSVKTDNIALGVEFVADEVSDGN